MGFPYLAPFKPWVVNVLKEREKSKDLKSISSPFVILTSGAKVVKQTPEADPDKRLEILQGILLNKTPAKYNGCIITNQNKKEELYQTNETMIGYDFGGKPIKVEGETNRRISTPIIDSLEIDTDGANNTLKTARITIKIFSLKQLEMFELFFLKPGMNLLVEFGDNSLDNRSRIKGTQTGEIPVYERISKSGEILDGKYLSSISQALIDKKNYENFVKNFSDYYRADTDAIARYLRKAEQTLGTYDLVAGKVTDFNFEIDENGIYTVTLTISQGNQLTLAIPLTNSNSQNAGKTGAPGSASNPTYQQYLESISVDFNLPDLTQTMAPADKYKNHLFNWGKLNEKQKDTSTSNKPYISIEFIVDILLNVIVSSNKNINPKDFGFEIPTYYKDANKTQPIKCIPIHYNQNIISGTEDVLFPNKTSPAILATKENKSTKIVFNPKNSKPADTSIGDLEILLKSGGAEVKELYSIAGIKVPPPNVDGKTPDMKFGNAANIFVSYIKVLEIWRKSGTRRDFLLKLLDLVNENLYGFSSLTFACIESDTQPTIVDTKLGITGMQIPKSEIYRFKPGTIYSNVRNFSFNFELSDLVASRTVFNSQNALMKAIKGVPKGQNPDLSLPKEALSSVDYSLYANADGYYSINQIDFIAINETWKKQTEKPRDSYEPDKEKQDNEAENLSEVIKSKSVKFKKASGDIVTMVFKDEKLIRTELHAEIKPKSTLAPIEITLEIDGLAGLSCGEYFNVDGVPEIYNQTGVFQIQNTKHQIDSEGWKTTIEAGYRIINKK
jgi:hypothetical protein